MIVRKSRNEMTMVDVKPEVKNTIEQLLFEYGIAPHYGGYLYIVEAVSMILLNESYLTNRQVVRGLYPAIGKKFGKTGTQVERCIRHAITKSFENLDPDDILKLYGRAYGLNCKMPNAQFIATIVRRVKQKESKQEAAK